MGSLYHMLGLLFSVAALIMLIFVNIGTTFTSSFLPNLYFTEASFGTVSIRFGPYSACVMNDGKTTCTQPTPAQGLDYTAYGIDGLSGVDTVALNKLSTAYKFIVLVIPAAVLALISMFGWLMIRENRSGNRLPIIGALSSVIGTICGAAALALVIICYRLAFRALQSKIPLTYQWGPSLYLLGVGSGCLLFSFILYVIVCVRHKKDYDYTYFQKDEYATHGDNRHYY